MATRGRFLVFAIYLIIAILLFASPSVDASKKSPSKKSNSKSKSPSTASSSSSASKDSKVSEASISEGLKPKKDGDSPKKSTNKPSSKKSKSGKSKKSKSEQQQQQQPSSQENKVEQQVSTQEKEAIDATVQEVEIPPSPVEVSDTITTEIPPSSSPPPPAAAAAEEPTPVTPTKKPKKNIVRKPRLSPAKAAARAVKRASALSARLQKASSHNRRLKQERIQRSKQKIESIEKRHKKLDAARARKAEYGTEENRSKALEKLRWMVKESNKNSNRMINLDENSFKYYINDGPRPYYVFLSITALHPQNNCQLCQYAHYSMGPTSIAYSETRSNLNLTRTIFDSDSDFDELSSYRGSAPVFFATLDVQRAPELFKLWKLNQVPVILMVPPKLSSKPRPLNQFLTKEIPSRFKFDGMNGGRFAPQEFEQFISKITLIHANIQEPGFSFAESFVMLLTLLFILSFSWLYRDRLMQLRSNQGISGIVQMIGWFGYMLCISGMMYNSLRGTPWNHVDKEKNEVTWINPDVRDQFGAEGYMMGMAILGAGFCTVLLNVGAYDALILDRNNSISKEGTFVGGKPGKEWYAPFVILIKSTFSPSVCMVGAAALWFAVIEVYSRKNYGYFHGFVWS